MYRLNNYAAAAEIDWRRERIKVEMGRPHFVRRMVARVTAGR